MSIDHGKLLALSPEAIEAGWRATFSTDNPFCPCDLKTFAKAARWAERALAQPAEAVESADRNGEVTHGLVKQWAIALYEVAKSRQRTDEGFTLLMATRLLNSYADSLASGEGPDDAAQGAVPGAEVSRLPETWHQAIRAPSDDWSRGFSDAMKDCIVDLQVAIEKDSKRAAQRAVAMIVRDCCEADRADPDDGETICIRRATLEGIIERHMPTHPQAAPAPSTAAVCDPEAVETLRHMTGYEWLADDQVDALNEAIALLGATTSRCSGMAGRWIDGLWVIDIATDSGIRLEVVKYDDDLKQRIKPSSGANAGRKDALIGAERASELLAAPAQGDGMVLVPLDAITKAATELVFQDCERAAADLLDAFRFAAPSPEPRS